MSILSFFSWFLIGEENWSACTYLQSRSQKALCTRPTLPSHIYVMPLIVLYANNTGKSHTNACKSNGLYQKSTKPFLPLSRNTVQKILMLNNFFTSQTYAGISKNVSLIICALDTRLLIIQQGKPSALRDIPNSRSKHETVSRILRVGLRMWPQDAQPTEDTGGFIITIKSSAYHSASHTGDRGSISTAHLGFLYDHDTYYKRNWQGMWILRQSQHFGLYF